MKIAHLFTSTNKLPPKGDQGRQILAYALIRRQAQKHDITVFADAKSNLPDKIKLASIPAFDVPKALAPAKRRHFRDMNTEFLLSFAYQRSGEFDIIHSHINERHLFFAPFSKCPTVVTQHWPLDEHIRKISKFMPADNVFVVPISKSQVRQGKGLLNYTEVVYNGLDPKDCKFFPKPRDHFVHISRLVPEKGAKRAIEACKKLGAKLKIAGKTNTSPKYKPYFDEIKGSFDGKQIDYIGEVPHSEVNKLFGEARAFLFPIEWEEPFGLVMIEAMVSGTPVIAFNHGSVPEIVKDGVTGFVVNTVDEMVAAMKKIDQIDRVACRKHVEDNFSIDSMVAGYERIYAEVLSKK